jgi:DNA repair exonuclease SbcCD nuclease subunit
LTFRFVHTADIHLDSPLRSLALRDEALAELIAAATRQSFIRTIDLCLDERVDALLLAGDLYDGEQTSMKTARFLAEQLGRLHQAGIKTFILRGNHDAQSKITKELSLPDTVKIFGGWAEAVSVEHDNIEPAVVIHGLSFTQASAPDSLLPKYKPAVAGAVNIGMLHTSLGGATGHDPYSPCSVADLQATGFEYWALGHIHKRIIHEGPCTIVMPGIPQGRDINEGGLKSVSLVTVNNDRSVQVEVRSTSIAQFERLTLELTGLDEWREILVAFDRAVGGAKSLITDKHLVVRLTLTGATPLAWRIRSDADLLKTELEVRASAIGDTWIEKLDIDCQSPVSEMFSEDDPIAELQRLIRDEVCTSDAFQLQITEIAEELRAALPAECRGILGSEETSFQAEVARLLADGSQDVLARLRFGHQTGQDDAS